MKRIRFLFWANAIFYILFGLLLVFQPAASLKAFIIVFSIEAILSWIIWGVFLIQEREYLEDKGLIACWLWLQILAWILLLIIPDLWETIIKIFVALLWVFLVVKWIALIFDSFKIKKAKFDNWKFMLVLWCCISILWVLITCNSLVAAYTFNILYWLWTLWAWLAMCAWGFQFRKDTKNIRKAVKNMKKNGIEIEITEVDDE